MPSYVALRIVRPLLLIIVGFLVEVYATRPLDPIILVVGFLVMAVGFLMLATVFRQSMQIC
jgi:positive regulator of sigma E activity